MLPQHQMKSDSQASSPPLIPLLHSLNQYCVMKNRDLFAMKKRVLRFNKTIKFSLSAENFINWAMLYASGDIYILHALIILSENIDFFSENRVAVGKSVLFSTSTHLSLSCHILIKTRQQCSKLQCVSHRIALSDF